MSIRHALRVNFAHLRDKPAGVARRRPQQNARETLLVASRLAESQSQEDAPGVYVD